MTGVNGAPFVGFGSDSMRSQRSAPEGGADLLVGLAQAFFKGLVKSFVRKMPVRGTKLVVDAPKLEVHENVVCLLH